MRENQTARPPARSEGYNIYPGSRALVFAAAEPWHITYPKSTFTPMDRYLNLEQLEVQQDVQELGEQWSRKRMT
jgi:hypothetical protein